MLELLLDLLHLGIAHRQREQAQQRELRGLGALAREELRAREVDPWKSSMPRSFACW